MISWKTRLVAIVGLKKLIRLSIKSQVTMRRKIFIMIRILRRRLLIGLCRRRG
jgi:hypothetical protein